MSDQIVPTDLPPRLRDVLDEISGSEHGPRFQLLFFAAATAIDVLGDLDFTHYEIDDFAERDGLWDTLAPTVEDTTNSVGAFLECVRTLFAVKIAEPDAVDDELDSWFEDLGTRAADAPPAMSESPEQRLEEVTALLQAICDGLSHELGRFRNALDDLRVHPDRWLLLDHIAMFRGKFREGIGAMVYMAARLFLDVTREEVVPAYRDDVENAILLRRELAGIRDRMRMFHAAVQRTSSGEELRELVARVGGSVDAFLASAEFRLVRAADKRPFGDVRRELGVLLEADSVDHGRALVFMEGLTRFLESLSAINGREALILHDAAAIREVRGFLMAARAAAEVHDRDAAVEPLRRALARCRSLLGREEGLDAACRVLQHVPLAELRPLEIAAAVRLLDDVL
ncbi:MAG: hypothetical protein QNK04_19695 [Myxococcota bacterium]|nr:hypothetical protein [Myxococcota bacterium]